ncbi:MAG: alpha-L-fucosidase [Erysipelotrichaceae bacterium]|nr:alpha-L-fucosidase [Erysipelotrichaceae bacterium]
MPDNQPSLGEARLDLDYKSPRTLIEMLNTCRRQNANYLLNIGPKGNESIPLMAQALLEQMGMWTNMAGSNFYDGVLSGIACGGDAYVLDAAGYSDVYVPGLPLIGVKNVVEEGEDNRRIIHMDHADRRIAQIRWLDSGEELKFEQDGSQVSFKATGYPYGRDLVARIARIS